MPLKLGEMGIGEPIKGGEMVDALEGTERMGDKGKLVGEVHIQVWENARPDITFTPSIQGRHIQLIEKSLKRAYHVSQQRVSRIKKGE